MKRKITLKMFDSNWKFVSLAALTCCLLAFAGCGKRDGLVPIKGTITLDGAPAASGSINFAPAEGVSGTTSGAKIGDGGKYEARVSRGKSLVTIYVQQEVERADATAEEIERGLTKTIVDVKFAEKQDDPMFTVDAQPGKTFDFSLTTAK